MSKPCHDGGLLETSSELAGRYMADADESMGLYPRGRNSTYTRWRRRPDGGVVVEGLWGDGLATGSSGRLAYLTVNAKALFL